MALTPDYANRVVHSDASITDVIAFHLALRGIEDSPEGILYPAIHDYKEVDLSGAVFPAINFKNGWQLQFPPGQFEMRGGNVKATIVPVAGCFLLQTQSAAYAVTAVGGSGPSADSIADAVWTHGFTKKLLTVVKFLSLKRS